MLGLDLSFILFFVLGLILLYIVGGLLLVPFKLLLKLSFNSILGALAIILINAIGGVFSITLPLNPINAVIIGTLGLPGVVLLLMIRLIFL